MSSLILFALKRRDCRPRHKRLAATGRVQARLRDVCTVYAVMPPVRASQHAAGSAVASVWETSGSSVLEVVETAVARCLRARVHSASSVAPLRPAHYAALLRAFSRHGRGSEDLWTDVAETAGHEMGSKPELWATQHVVGVVEAAAAAKLRAHHLFEACSPLILQRLDAPRDARVQVPFGRADVMGDPYSGLTAEEMERVLWAFAVVRRSYPYTARSVVTGVARALTAALVSQPHVVPVDTMAAMLWTCAAASHTPRALFMAALHVVDALPEAPDAEVRESLTWSFNRARISVPWHCRAEAAWFL